MADRAAGLLGITGGLVLLAAFLPAVGIPPELNTVRLVLFNAGAIAVALAVHRRQAATAPRVSAAAAAAVVLANAGYLVVVVVGTGRPQPPEPDPAFRFVGFLVGVAMWWADAAFGLVARRLRTVNRWGAAALAIGSVLAFLGMGHLELVNGDLGWLVQPAALVGIALNGIGWIVLGAELVFDTRGVASEPATSQVQAG